MKDLYRILLADDHRVIRQGIQRVIEEKPGLKVIGGVDDGIELLKAVRDSRPDMVIVDLSMPKIDGIQAIRQIKADYPLVKILVLTMYKEKYYLSEAVSAGADGYLVKEDADIELYDAIETIRQGKPFISPILSKTVTDTFMDMTKGRSSKAGTDEITPRQMEILKLIAEGKSSKEIADRLFISVRTVGNHRANIMKRLGARKNTELVRFAIRKGYIPATDMH
jgi:DNA-binding NarL/FixJ family response regulator